MDMSVIGDLMTPEFAAVIACCSLLTGLVGKVLKANKKKGIGSKAKKKAKMWNSIILRLVSIGIAIGAAMLIGVAVVGSGIAGQVVTGVLGSWVATGGSSVWKKAKGEDQDGDEDEEGEE